MSWAWASDNYCKNFETILVPMLATARERGNACIDLFTGPDEILKTEGDLIGVYGTLLIRASNLLGQIHEMGTTVEESAPEFFGLVNRTPWFRPIFERFEANLKALDESYPDWKGRDVFNSLQLTCEALLNAGGMFYRRYPLGGYFIALTRPPE